MGRRAEWLRLLRLSSQPPRSALGRFAPDHRPQAPQRCLVGTMANRWAPLKSSEVQHRRDGGCGVKPTAGSSGRRRSRERERERRARERESEGRREAAVDILWLSTGLSARQLPIWVLSARQQPTGYNSHNPVTTFTIIH
jgi:hypothetical protein